MRGADRGGRLAPGAARRAVEVIERHMWTSVTACLSDQAARKPWTAAARLVRGGLTDRLRRHPLDSVVQAESG